MKLNCDSCLIYINKQDVGIYTDYKTKIPQKENKPNSERSKNV